MFINNIVNNGYQAEKCQLCKVAFSIMQQQSSIRKLQRIHKCKRCNSYVCSKCSRDKIQILQKQGYYSQKPLRVCNICKDDIQLINNSIQCFEMKWCCQGPISNKWIESIQNEDYDYHYFQKLFYKNLPNYEQQSIIIQKDVFLGRTDYTVFNFSMKHFIYQCQRGFSLPQARNDIANVLYAICAKFDQVGYCQGMSPVIAYLLCFCSQQSCFKIYSYILEFIYPKNFFIKSNFGLTMLGLVAEVYLLQQYFVIILQKRQNVDNEHYSQSQLERFKIIIELLAPKCLLSLFITMMSFSNIFFIWQQIQMQKSFLVIQKAFLSLIYLQRKKILTMRSFQGIQQRFLKISSTLFIEIYSKIQLDPSIKKNLLEKYYNHLSTEWTKSSERNLKSLSKVTQFNQLQIQHLQKYFVVTPDGIVIEKDNFLKLLDIYTKKQVEFYPNKTFIIEPFYCSKIFDSYNNLNKTGLDFREFVCCLSVCTKGRLKQKLSALMNSYQQKTKFLISHQTVQKLITKVCQTVPQQLTQQADLFHLRMKKIFKNQHNISVNQMYILLNDYFISQLTLQYPIIDQHVLIDAVNQFLQKKQISN